MWTVFIKYSNKIFVSFFYVIKQIKLKNGRTSWTNPELGDDS